MKNIYTNLIQKGLFLFVFCFGITEVFAQALPITNSTAGTVTYTPDFTGCVRVQIWGGGGGGGASSGNGGAGGGAGGGYSEGYISVTSGVGISYTVGAGGAGAAVAANKAGGNGGTSTFGAGATLLTATGGTGGAAGSKSASGGTTGAVSAGGSVSNTTLNTGGAGGASQNNNKGGGGGGGAAGGPIANGGAGANGTGTAGAGGLSDGVGGGGGDGGAQQGPGVNGTAPGGGGGGGGSKGGASQGGNGGAGRIIISAATSTCPGSTAVTSAFPQQSCQNNATGFTVLTATSTLVKGCGTPTVQFRWYFNTTNSNTVAGATDTGITTSTITPPNNLAIGSRWYFCVAFASNNGCGQTATTQMLASNAVEMQITANTAPTTVAVMANQTICINSSTALAGTTPVVGTGTWAIVSGPNTALSQISNINSPTATFTPTGVSTTGSVYTLSWTICAGSCNPCSTRNMTVTVNCGGACPACPLPFTHSTVGIQNEYVGDCLVNTCSGTYTDDGGAAGNYSLNINQIYRVFCPSNALSCVRATFTQFVTETTFDFMTIGNGPTQNSLPILQAPANLTTGRLSGDLSASTPFSFTSTHASGCLSMRFRSDASVAAAGWNATLSCVPCAGGPAGTDDNDCNNATPTCTNRAVGVNATGPGISSDGCTGTVCPAGGENHANWFRVRILTPGTFGFNVVPSTGSDDYDVTVFGPTVTCGTLGSPIRCSDSGLTGTTGVNGGDTDGVDAAVNTLPGNDAGINENVLGDKNLDFIAATIGQEYLIMIDEWTPTGGGFNLNFAGTATLDCAIVLPIELSKFEVEYLPETKQAELKWKTESERGNDFFTVQKSLNGLTWYDIATIKGAGNSSSTIDYSIFDNDVAFAINYYRLKQTDYDGKYSYSKIVSVNPVDEENYSLVVYPNPTSGLTDLIYKCSKEEVVYVQVINSKGIVVINKQSNGLKGVNYDYLDFENLNSGLYFVKITTSNKVFTEKVTKK